MSDKWKCLRCGSDLSRSWVVCDGCKLALALGADWHVARSYPRTDADGRTVWACCESSIGRPCAHERAAAR